MAEPRAIKPSLAELIRAHYRPRSERAGGQVQRPPGLRLQDWRVVDAVSVDAVEYVLLRRAAEPKNGLDSLTPRERDVVRHACTGASNKDIACQMNISDSTVGVLLLRACRKLEAADRRALVRDYGTGLLARKSFTKSP